MEVTHISLYFRPNVRYTVSLKHMGSPPNVHQIQMASLESRSEQLIHSDAERRGGFKVGLPPLSSLGLHENPSGFQPSHSATQSQTFFVAERLLKELGSLR